MDPQIQAVIASEVGRLRLAELEAGVMISMLRQENDALRARIAELEGQAKESEET